jgi:hypothetical protein
VTAALVGSVGRGQVGVESVEWVAAVCMDHAIGYIQHMSLPLSSGTNSHRMSSPVAAGSAVAAGSVGVG